MQQYATRSPSVNSADFVLLASFSECRAHPTQFDLGELAKGISR